MQLMWLLLQHQKPLMLLYCLFQLLKTNYRKETVWTNTQLMRTGVGVLFSVEKVKQNINVKRKRYPD